MGWASSTGLPTPWQPRHNRQRQRPPGALRVVALQLGLAPPSAAPPPAPAASWRPLLRPWCPWRTRVAREGPAAGWVPWWLGPGGGRLTGGAGSGWCGSGAPVLGASAGAAAGPWRQWGQGEPGQCGQTWAESGQVCPVHIACSAKDSSESGQPGGFQGFNEQHPLFSTCVLGSTKPPFKQNCPHCPHCPEPVAAQAMSPGKTCPHSAQVCPGCPGQPGAHCSWRWV